MKSLWKLYIYMYELFEDIQFCLVTLKFGNSSARATPATICI